jgi:hypothetical protein
MKTEGTHILPGEEISVDAHRMVKILEDSGAAEGGEHLLKNAVIGMYWTHRRRNQASFFRECKRDQ